jgi:hypothetical protein
VPVPPFIDDRGHGIFAIDIGYQRPRFDATHLLRVIASDRGRAAFIDTGTQHVLPRHLGALRSLGLSPERITARRDPQFRWPEEAERIMRPICQGLICLSRTAISLPVAPGTMR